MKSYKVVYDKRTICTCDTREEAVKRCEAHARKLTPIVVNPSTWKHTTVEYKIKLMEDGKTLSTEIYTVIVAMKR